MKKKILLSTSLCLLTCLTSCGGLDFNSTLFIQNGDVSLSYAISSPLKAGSKITGCLNISEGITLKDSYSFGYTFFQPTMSSTSLEETGFYVFTKDKIEGKTKVSFETTLDLEKVFPKDNEEGKVYFIVHSSDFSFDKIATYSYSTFSYRWSGENVTLAN